MSRLHDTMAAASQAPDMGTWAGRYAPGISFVAAVTAVATMLGRMPVWPFTDQASGHPVEPVIMAITLGLVVGNVWRLPSRLRLGVGFTAKKVLAIGIILLGARLDFRSLVHVGAAGVAFSICIVVTSLLLFRCLIALFKLDRIEGLLLGIGTAICGGTAIVAIAPLLRARDETVFVAVAVVTLLGVVAMLILPPLGILLGLTDWQFGVWAGLTVHQTPQVIAAGFAFSPAAGETATVVKLARVCLLAPVALGIGIMQSRTRCADSGVPYSWRRSASLIPGFVIGFLLMALARTLGLIPDIDLRWNTPFSGAPLGTRFSLHVVFVEASAFLLAMSMAAVGLETNISALGRKNLRPFTAAAVATTMLAILAFGLVHITDGPVQK